MYDQDISSQDRFANYAATYIESDARGLNALRYVNTLDTHASRGALFVTFVVSELVKRRFNQGQASDLYFWRDSTGHEVDVLIDTPKRTT